MTMTYYTYTPLGIPCIVEHIGYSYIFPWYASCSVLRRCASPDAPLGEDVEDVGGDLLRVLVAVDAHEQAPALVEGQQRRGVALVGLESLDDGLGQVVRALHHVAAAVGTRAGDGLDVAVAIDGPALLADPTGRETLRHQLVGHVEIDADLDAVLAQDGVECLGLGVGARIAVEQRAALGVGLGETLLDQPIDQFVGDQLAGLEDGGDLQADGRAVAHGGAQDVTR